MVDDKTLWLMMAKALFLLAATAYLLLFALVMGAFATGSPGLTESETGYAFAIVFGLFAIPAFWPLRAFCRIVRNLAREVHRDDHMLGGENDAG